MLAGGDDPFYRRILAAAHEPYFRIDVYSGSGTFLRTLEKTSADSIVTANHSYFSGGVNATLTSRVSRTCDFVVHESLYPVNDTDLLAPYGNFIRAYRGVKLNGQQSQYVWQVFEGRIQQATLGSDGTCTVSCSDRAADVIDNGFTVPQNSNLGQNCVQQMQDLIVDGFPNADFGTSDAFDQVMPRLTWESDRGSALDEIGQSLGAFWYPLATAEFVVRKIPWTVPGSAVVTLVDGDGGTITGYRVSRSRSDVYNVIAVTGERTDGTTPVSATSSDTNPTSPTVVTGDFGLRTRTVHLQTPGSQGSVQSVANDLLRSSIALTEAWDLSTVPDASLELGDVVAIEAAGRTGVIQVVSGFQLPLDYSGPMTLALRSQVIGSLEVNE